VARYSAKVPDGESTADRRSYPGTYFIEVRNEIVRVVFGWFCLCRKGGCEHIFHAETRISGQDDALVAIARLLIAPP
jgi:hypothetical protein